MILQMTRKTPTGPRGTAKHHAAFEQRKPGMLTGMYAEMQAAPSDPRKSRRREPGPVIK